MDLFSALERLDYVTVKSLLDTKADVNQRDGDGSTPLHIAATIGDKKLCKIVLRAGGLLSHRNRDGRLPAATAAHHGHEALALYFESKQQPAENTASSAGGGTSAAQGFRKLASLERLMKCARHGRLAEVQVRINQAPKSHSGC